MIHTVKGFSVVNETEVDVFLEFLCFHYDPVDVGNLISGSFAFSKPNLDMWRILIYMMMKPSLKDFEHNLTRMRKECNCMVAWTFFSTALLGNCDENWAFPVLWPLLGFPNLLTYWVQHLIASSFWILNSSAGIPSPLLALLEAVLPEGLLTLYSRMSGSWWMTTPLWLSGSLRSFFVQFYSCHPFLDLFCFY